MTEPATTVDPAQDEALTSLGRVNRMLSRAPDDPEAADQVAAVVSWCEDHLERPAAGWRSHHHLGATMLAARLERRKDSPGGLATFGMEVQAGYVSGNWSDVAMLLGLAQYAVGRVG